MISAPQIFYYYNHCHHIHRRHSIKSITQPLTAMMQLGTSSDLSFKVLATTTAATFQALGYEERRAAPLLITPEYLLLLKLCLNLEKSDPNTLRVATWQPVQRLCYGFYWMSSMYMMTMIIIIKDCSPDIIQDIYKYMDNMDWDWLFIVMMLWMDVV